MNVFELRGPQFLWFFVAFTIVLLIVTRILRKMLDRMWAVDDAVHMPQASSMVSDPYFIAHLRGGAKECVRVAVLSLMDRGLIKLEGSKLKTKGGITPDHARRPIEREALSVFATGGNVADFAKLEPACDQYERELRRAGLVVSPLKAYRFYLFAAMALVLGYVAGKKIFIGLQRGRPVLFLIVLAVIAFISLISTAMRRQTAQGDDFLADVNRLFRGLRERASAIKPGGATAELALLAAVFGVTVVPVSLFPHKSALFPVQTSSSSSSSGCGSSSSCGSSCGGGCGGGCGGCGS